MDSKSTRTFSTKLFQQELSIKDILLCIVINNIIGEEGVMTAGIELKVKGVGMKWIRALRLREVMVKNEFSAWLRYNAHHETL